ncbi:MAG: hypothetical protein RBS16_03560 [Candidatus Cloacimonadales bacterium]|nr:hypothetical protein [Candidatus Cloacimonadota bacterium]MDX9977090.1 hypothetical protein [Candidatus Cloacimonadales bacterium]NLB48491.1 hypothetical protein [Erysipelotrichia bacterium]
MKRRKSIQELRQERTRDYYRLKNKKKDYWHIIRVLAFLAALLIVLTILIYLAKKKDYSQYNLQRYIEFHQSQQKRK